LGVLITPALFALLFIVVFWFINKTLLPKFARY